MSTYLLKVCLYKEAQKLHNIFFVASYTCVENFDNQVLCTQIRSRRISTICSFSLFYSLASRIFILALIKTSVQHAA